MANEISIVMKLNASKGSLSVTKGASFRVDMSGADYSGATIDVTSTAQLIAYTTLITDVGWSFFRNLSETETIQVGIQEDAEYGGRFWAVAEMLPGEAAMLPLATTNDLAAKSLGLTAKLEWLILER